MDFYTEKLKINISIAVPEWRGVENCEKSVYSAGHVTTWRSSCVLLASGSVNRIIILNMFRLSPV